MSTSTVLRDFARYSQHLPEVEPDVVETLVSLKESYFDDPDPTRWRVDVLRELTLEVLPRKVTAPDDWFTAVVPSMRTYVGFLASHNRLRGGDSAQALLAELDRIGDGVVAASRDPRNFGMAKAFFSQVGFDPSAPDPVSLPLLDGDPFEDLDEPWPSLPLVWLPPAAQLADGVRSAPLVRSLLQLADWNDTGHKVTRQEVLPLPAARRACADLGLPLPATTVRGAQQIPALHKLWSLAVGHDVLVIEEGSARRGQAADLLTRPDSDPVTVLDWWLELFGDCLDWGLDVGEDPDRDEDLDEDVLDAVDDVVEATLTELYPGGQVPESDLTELMATAVEETCAEDPDAFWLSPQEVREQARERWDGQVAQLLDLGAVVIEDGLLSLTPLGRAGVRAVALAHGADAPVADDPAAVDAATLLEHLPELGDTIAEPLFAAWSAARTPEQATEELLGAARAGTARTRLTAVAVLAEEFHDHVTGAGRPRLETLRDDPVLGLLAHVLLAEAEEEPPALPPHLRQWAVLEAVAIAVDSGVLDHDPGDDESAAQVWQLVAEDADLDSAWRSPHPQLIEILETIAARHPKGRVRRAAKKALFKTRQRAGNP